MMMSATTLTLQAQTPQAPVFPGWETLRVIEQDGHPYRLYAADLDGEKGDELIVVNLRNARLEFLHWNTDPPPTQDTTQADTPDTTDAHINDLPMAPEIERVEFPLKQTPIDLAIRDTDHDGQPELYVLVTDPNRLLRLIPNTPDEDEKSPVWKIDQKWELLPGHYNGSGRLLQFVETHNGETTLLISGTDGIQRLRLDENPDTGRAHRATWMQPRETLGRNDWWLADLDGDGRDDLVEWTDTTDQTIRWYRQGPDGFLPAQPLHDRSAYDVAMLNHDAGPDELLILESSPAGMVRRYRLTAGDPTDLGQREALTLPGGADKAVWTISALDGLPVLIAADPEQPRVTLFRFTDAGWTADQSFPVIADIKDMVAPAGETMSVLLWPREGGDLYRTTWSNGRLTFPQPLGLGADADEHDILGLGRVGSATWCVQKSDKDLTLHRWAADAEQPQTTVFTDAAGKADEAIWLGDAGLLVFDKFGKGLRHVRHHGDETLSTEPAHLAKAKLNEFRVFASEQEKATRIARVTDGVLQWLDHQLQAQDQVMLPDGLRLGGLVMLPDGDAWALQQNGLALHRLSPDDAGVLRVIATERILDGRRLFLTPELGLLLQTGPGVTHLAHGTPWQLDVTQSIDARAGKPTGVRDVAVHRIHTADIDGDGHDDAVFHDDLRHQLTVSAADPDDPDADLKPLISWPFFEDRSYPYGNAEDQQIREPRTLIALDIDGDGQQDLALLSHDRLLLYLAKKPTIPTTTTTTEPAP